DTTIGPPGIIKQPVGQSVDPGQTVTFRITAVGAAPLTYQWLKDGTPLAAATAASLTLTNVQGPNSGNYQVVVSNPLGSVTSAVAVLTVNVPTNTTVDSFNPQVIGSVNSLALQADGKIVVGGSFTALEGSGRDSLGRLNLDGSLDPTFNPAVGGTFPSGVSALAVQTDGKILIGGSFALGGQTRYNIGRLNTDGSLDNVFSPTVAGGNSPIVHSLVTQTDDKILVAGVFTALNAQARTNIGRLNADGQVDTGFNVAVNGPIDSLTLQEDGKILIGGSFTTLGGQTRKYIARLNADVSLDVAFNPGASDANNFPPPIPGVHALALQADKEISGDSMPTERWTPRSIQESMMPLTSQTLLLCLYKPMAKS
ncbi:MAG: hypothetical protein DME18_08170, partial [Verrucomicrobia bacterium]